MDLNRPLSKRQLGILLVSLGLLGAAISLLVDFLAPTRFAGLGPSQGLAVMGGLALAVFGISLIIRGDRPA